MARVKDKEIALVLRKQGKSYSEIKAKLGISKSTLSGWLHDHPLSKDDLVRLRDKNPIRIEKCRETKRKKREVRLNGVKERVMHDLTIKTSESYFLSGFFLYWGEGGKTKPYTVTMSNTDPSVVIFFLGWLEQLGWDRKNVKVRIHLYSDMDKTREQKYWEKVLALPETCFQKPYIKKTFQSSITYKTKQRHGTCNVIVNNRDLSEYILMGIEVLQERFSKHQCLPVLKRSVGYTRKRA
jgi:predicted transcriptional regulator